MTLQQDHLTPTRNGHAPAARRGRVEIPTGPRVSVVIPTLNEASNLHHVFSRLPGVFEVIVVDGGSTDGTIQIARLLRPDVRVIRQLRRGKGNALACGFHACRGDIAVTLDADGSTEPREIPRFVDALLRGAHLAKGTRFARGGGSADITHVRHAGTAALNQLVNHLYRTQFSDLNYGYSAVWTACLPHLQLSEPGIELPPDGSEDDHWTGSVPGDEERRGDGFEVEAIVLTRTALLGMTVVEVASFEQSRLHGHSNLNVVRDGMRILRAVQADQRLFRADPGAGPLPRPWERFRSHVKASRAEATFHPTTITLPPDADLVVPSASAPNIRSSATTGADPT